MPAAAPSGQTFSDDFNRGDNDSLGANWTEVGDADIVSNRMRLMTASWAICGGIHNTTTDTVNQYAKASFDDTQTGALGYPSIILRYTNASSPYYAIQWEATGTVTWNYYSSLGEGEHAITSGSIAYSAGHFIGVTVTGTGDNTVVSVWYDPTGASPTSATEWGGDSTPNLAFTTNPGAYAVDTGNKIGLVGVFSSGPHVEFDDFSGGDIP